MDGYIYDDVILDCNADIQFPTICHLYYNFYTLNKSEAENCSFEQNQEGKFNHPVDLVYTYLFHAFI